MPKDEGIRKVLMIGSGPIVIGQAAEFDYAGAQACRVLRQEGVEVALVNSNPATIMTDQALADEIYLEPLTVPTLKRIIQKEKPDSLLAGLGGQTALTLAMQLQEEGFLAQEGVRLIGVNTEAIEKAEDRKLFKETMEEIGQPVIPSGIATSVEEAVNIAREIGYPVIVRPAYTLGGAGGGSAADEAALREIAKGGLTLSPITQVLIEKSVAGWKEIEFEVMRDGIGNVIAVCSMENVDPVGVHTGDSVVVAPALTLSDKEYQILRSASLDIISALGIVGGCNCQFALDPESFEYAVIEVNPRVSRSSALASKATGYPIAKVATRIALGYTLDEIKNEVTGKTCACFEPTLDYVVVKMPKWPFDKFASASRTLGTQMKATGEVMAIGPSFEMALMKAIRGAEIGLDTLNRDAQDPAPLRERLHRADDHRLFTVFEALKAGISVDEIHEITKIDEFFLWKLKGLADFEAAIAGGLTDAQYLEGKRLGYPDGALRRLSGRAELPQAQAIYRMVDTCAAEFDAETPYFYATYEQPPLRLAFGEGDSEEGSALRPGAETLCESRLHPRSGKPVMLVLGSGPIRIGQGIEFDYSSVHCVWTLRQLGYDVVIINNNPETVSTDYDTADRLYFEPLTEEDVLRVMEVEKPEGVVVAFGGQTAIRLVQALDRHGIPILGTSADGIDLAEDRSRFDALLERFGIRRPQGESVLTLEEALAAAQRLGYPVLLRPSYVIGGQNMTIARRDEDVVTYMTRILAHGIENPVLVDQYMPGTELEVDVISDGKDVLIPGIMQHVERAGVHSGDSIAVYPPFTLDDHMMDTVVSASEQLALALGTKGLVNIQYLVFHGELYVIEVNPRASRTVPYISKVTGVPMVDLAARVMLGQPLASLGYGTGLRTPPPYWAVKVPVFSFEKLTDANAYLGPEMKSTGEVLGIGKTVSEALFKGLTAAGLRVTEAEEEAGVLLSVADYDYPEIIDLARRFHDLHCPLYATEGTAQTIARLGIPVKTVSGLRESDHVFDLLSSGEIRYIVYTGALLDDTLAEYIALHRRALALGIPCFTSLDTARALADTLLSRYSERNTELVNLNAMRAARQQLRFVKMQATGNDYILIDALQERIDGIESLCVRLCENHFGAGAEGLALLRPSQKADVRMLLFNRDGTEAAIGGNALRCVAKYLVDRGLVSGQEITIETAGGIRSLRAMTRFGQVQSVTIDMGPVSFAPADVPVNLDYEQAIHVPIQITGPNKARTGVEIQNFRVTCVSVGNPHCVVFTDEIDLLDLPHLGPLFEHSPLFPNRVNTEFIRVVNPTTLRMRVWERGSGETTACGTGACAAVAAAVVNGYCQEGTDIQVQVPGGNLYVRYESQRVTLRGNVGQVYEASIEY
ncbi:MAG: carbamoyl-phosphate synthase large subunit [Clostridia bacterium]|nr:carbamoyl-phosphate synthase large subunit [Clostridia bacterium]